MLVPISLFGLQFLCPQREVVKMAKAYPEAENQLMVMLTDLQARVLALESKLKNSKK